MTTAMQLPPIPTTDLETVTGGADAGAIGGQIGGLVQCFLGGGGGGE